MNDEIKISYVLLSYYSDVHLLQKNLTILKNKQVIIVDNTDDNLKKTKLLISTDKNITILEQLTNSGYAKGMNTGMSKAWEEQSNWVVLLNDDVELTMNVINKLEQVLTGKKPGIYGPWSGIIDSARWTTITTSNKDKTDYISGSFIIIHREVDKHLRGFYEPFFMYYEDVDYCVRARKLGFPIEKIDMEGINHFENHSIGKGSEKHVYYLARNHLVFIFRQAPFFIKFREILRLPKTWSEERNTSGFRGLFHALIHHLGPYKG